MLQETPFQLLYWRTKSYEKAYYFHCIIIVVIVVSIKQLIVLEVLLNYAISSYYGLHPDG